MEKNDKDIVQLVMSIVKNNLYRTYISIVFEGRLKTDLESRSDFRNTYDSDIGKVFGYLRPPEGSMDNYNGFAFLSVNFPKTDSEIPGNIAIQVLESIVKQDFEEVYILRSSKTKTGAFVDALVRGFAPPGYFHKKLVVYSQRAEFYHKPEVRHR
jgi:hypothetical protein